MSTPSQVLLAICVFLFLTPGDALLCKRCIVTKPGVPCHQQTCEINDEGICAAIISYQNEEIIDKILDCAKKENVRCDIPSRERDGIRQELRCCDHTDFCNANF